MSNKLSDVIAEVASRGRPISRLGVVTAIDSTNKALTIDVNPGDPSNPSLLTGIRWFDTYTPTLDDLVGLIAIGSGWWVLGKNSYDLRGNSRVKGQTIVHASSYWTGMYVGALDQWTWETAANSLLGVYPASPGTPSQDERYYSLIQFGAPEIPSGAVLQNAYLTYRASSVYSGGVVEEMRLAAHSYTSRPSGAFSDYAEEHVDFANPEARPRSYQVGIPSAVAASLAAGVAKGITLSPSHVYSQMWIDSAQIIFNYVV